MVGENTSRFLPPAAASPIRTASAGPQFRNVTPSAGAASSGWWVSTKIGPCQTPPYGRLPSMAWSQPFRPPRIAPVVAMYSSCPRDRRLAPVSVRYHAHRDIDDLTRGQRDIVIEDAVIVARREREACPALRGVH